MIKITLPGEPHRYVSPTFSKYGTYDSIKHLKHAAKFQVLDQVRKYPSLPFNKSVPIQIEMGYYFPIPKGKENLFHWGLLDMIEAPDFDNVSKFYCDIVKSIVFHDDRQINLASISKDYSENPRTEILIVAKKPEASDQVKEVLSLVPPSEISSIADYICAISDWCSKNENPYHLSENCTIDYEEVAYIILDLAEKHADNLKKINKKFPGLAKILKDKLENK